MSRLRAVSFLVAFIRSAVIRRALIPCALVSCALILGAGRAQAADPPAPTGGARLTFRFKSANPPIRTGAPFSVDYVFNSTFADVLTGELEIEFVEDDRVNLRMRTDPIAVASGKNSYHLLLPPTAARRDAAAFSVRVRFLSSKGMFDLGKHDLLVPMHDARQFLIAAPNLSRNTVARFAAQLRLDAFRPNDNNLRRADLLTLPIEVDLPNMPTQAIGLYPFDLLLLADDGFSRLSARQLEAIAEWVEQGGRVVVVPTGVLTPAHKSFLDRITSHAAAPGSFNLDPLGHLEVDEPGSKPSILPCRFGFGRALVLRALPEIKEDGSMKGISAAEWTRAVCFIWNVDPSQMQSILNTGIWIPPPKAKPGYEVDLSPLRPREFATAGSLRQLLFPRTVRVMPFGVVATILALFLLAIAPGDYYLYGLLRRWPVRWIAFPVTCLAFTLGTVWIAGNYTGRVDHRTELVIVDLGEDGKPLRTTRIEHVLTAQTRPVSLDLHNALFAMTDVQPSTTPTQRDEFGRRQPTNLDDDLDLRESLTVPSYAGTLPSNFSVTRPSRQWSPSMHRITRPGTDVTVPPIAWSELDSVDLSSDSGRKQLLDSVRRAAPECDVFLENSERLDASIGSGPFLERNWQREGWEGVLKTLARRREGGLFSIITHVAPSGAGDLEDLAVLGSDQSDDCLLQVALHQDNGLVVFRKMFHPKLKSQSGRNR
jgi:hypothetical protein